MLYRVKINSLIASMLLTISYQSAALETYGTATIVDGDINQARNIAYENALREASDNNGIRIHSSSNYSNGQINYDNIELRQSSRPLQTTILDENINGNQLKMQVESNQFVVDKNCGDKSSKYRKKIGLTQISIKHPKDIGLHDYYGYERGIAADLAYQLSKTHGFLTRDISHYSVFETDAGTPALTIDRTAQQSHMLALARRYNVQFILTARITDLSLITDSIYQHTPSLINDYFPQNPYSARNLSVEFYLYDALSGELLSRNMHSATINGADVYPEEAIAYESGKFEQSSVGKTFKKILSQQVDITDKLLECRPLVASVIKNKDDLVYLDAGADTGVNNGDIFSIYHPDIDSQTFSVDGLAEQFGWEEAQTEIIKVFPAYSVGRLSQPVAANRLLHMRAW